MNNLSLFIYLAEIVENLRFFLQLFVVLFPFFGAIGSIIYKGESIDNVLPNWWIFTFFFILFIAVTLLVFLPTKTTLYAIAASELGEDLLKSELGQTVTLSLENWVKAQLQQK